MSKAITEAIGNTQVLYETLKQASKHGLLGANPHAVVSELQQLSERGYSEALLRRRIGVVERGWVLAFCELFLFYKCK